MATKPSPAAGRGQDAGGGRDLKALEQRRFKAARLFAHGTSQAKVARALGVSAQTASRWHARWQQGGARALRAPARQGRPPKLSSVQLRQLERALLKGARGHGFDEELWTLRRVAEVIWRLAGVRYHPGQVWRIGLWANVKGGELANRCCQTAEEVIATAQVGMIRVRRDGQLPLSFLRQTGLTL